MPTRAATSVRDTAVDVARAGALMVVVFLHAMMVGVSRPDGQPLFENTMATWAGFPLASWFVQIMPLFFVLGGFSAYIDWTRRRVRGVSPGGYLVSRVRRLALPAIGAMAATAIFLVTISASGVGPYVVGEAGFRTGQPFWFLAVYILCTALAPVMIAAHERAPWLTAGLLLTGVVVVDITRAATGVEAIGLLNLLCVWLLVQQGGFFLADGTVDRLSRPAALAIACAAIALLAGSQWAGIYPLDLYAALNPPTLALVLLGTAQLLLFAQIRPALRRAYTWHPVRRAVDAIGARSMTIYAWHMPLLIGLAGLSLLSPALMPEPLSAQWWSTRPLWLLVAGIVVGVAARVFGRIEASRGPALGHIRTRTAWLIAATAAAGVVMVLVAGSQPAAWIAAVLLLATALFAGRRTARPPRVPMPLHEQLPSAAVPVALTR